MFDVLAVMWASVTVILVGLLIYRALIGMAAMWVYNQIGQR